MRRVLAGLIVFALLAASCVAPTPGPAPISVPVAPVGRATAGFGDVFGLGHTAPLIMTTDGDYNAAEANASHIRDVASYYGVLWMFNWLDYDKSPLATVKNPIDLLRSLNPKAVVIGGTHTYLIPWSGCSNPAFPQTCAIYGAVDGNDWYVYDAAGKRLKTGTGSWINWTQGYASWLADFVIGQAARQCGGVPCYNGFYVESEDIPHGIGSFFSADLDRDGKQDMDPARLTKCQLDAVQMDGYAAFARSVNEATGLPVGGESFGPGLAGAGSPNYLLGKETLYFDGAFPNGAWPDCTTDPYGGRGGYTYLGDAWGLHMASALAFQGAGTPGVLLRGDMAFPTENQARRFTLATGMMTDMYTVPHIGQNPDRWPCDECLVNAAGRSTDSPADLGWAGRPQGDPFRLRDGVTMAQAIARGERLADDVWGRFYTNGFALTNPTSAMVTVNLPEGYAAVDATSRPGGDTAVNNGRPVRSVSIAPNDGRILRRLPGPLPTTIPPVTLTPRPSPTATARPTVTPTPTLTPSPTPTLTDLEQVKKRVSALETVVAGLK